MWEQFGDDHFLFPHDCTPVHKARSIKTWMSEFGVGELDWPAEDQAFLKIMERDFHKDETNFWVAPLPFKSPRPLLPSNRDQALSRLISLKCTLDNRLEMRDNYLEFMGKILQNRHAELAPPLKENEESWYLPTFGVYHP
ncbi:hypothetical protein QTP70_007861 [Hemibagrus guttatus]|uniref:Uncharacterized protein n=1 Tax=Hemibagrus guttatus TaxID=175788 RepID=A0AAE0V1I9_9TELE|nr:hypothetical protein QTP70_007861 [Hemibagrus guttatus]